MAVIMCTMIYDNATHVRIVRNILKNPIKFEISTIMSVTINKTDKSRDESRNLVFHEGIILSVLILSRALIKALK